MLSRRTGATGGAMTSLDSGGGEQPAEFVGQGRAPGWFFAIALFAVGLFGIVLKDLDWFRSVPGDLGDARFNSVVLEHLYRTLTGAASSLWDPEFFYPFTGILAFSDNHLGSGATYVLGRLVGLSREHAVDLWYLLAFPLNFAAATWALRRFGLDLAAAAIGAFVFTFALPVLAQETHLQLAYRFPVPLAALGLWHAVRARRLLGLAGVAFWTTWQFFCSIYMGIFLLYLLAAMALALLLLDRPFGLAAWREGWRATPGRARLGAALLVLFCAAALAWLLGSYLVVSRHYGLGRDLSEIAVMLPRWASYFVTDRVPYLSDLTAGLPLPMRHEHQLFVGFAALALLLVGLVAALLQRTPHQLVGRVMFVALALLVLGTLWFADLSLYYLVAWLPGISSMRAVTRVIVVLLLPVSVLVAIGASVLAGNPVRRRAAGWAILALTGLAVTVEPLLYRPNATPIAQWQERMAAARALLPPELSADAILWVRTGSTDGFDITLAELDGMILGQDLDRPTLNGYSGYQPPGQRFTNSCTAPVAQLAAYARFTGADVTDLATRVVTLDLSPCRPQ